MKQKRAMVNKIIEILEIGFPKSIIQREGEPISELIETEQFVQEINNQLNLMYKQDFTKKFTIKDMEDAFNTGSVFSRNPEYNNFEEVLKRALSK